jgi:hypothetical protein
VAWRSFLRGLAVELDVQTDADTRREILRGIGLQMARQLGLVPAASLEALEMEMNGVLAEIGWGRVQVTLMEAERYVVMIHFGLPRIGSAGEPPGNWLAPVLEGLYHGWMGQQPGAESSFRTGIVACEHDKIVIRYGR